MTWREAVSPACHRHYAVLSPLGSASCRGKLACEPARYSGSGEGPSGLGYVVDVTSSVAKDWLGPRTHGPLVGTAAALAESYLLCLWRPQAAGEATEGGLILGAGAAVTETNEQGYPARTFNKS